MSETERTPLQIIAAFESGAFRVGQVARRLIAEHPELPLQSFAPTASSSHYGYDLMQVEITPDDNLDGVHLWALAFGAEVTVKRCKYGEQAEFDHASFELEIDGVAVKVSGTRQVPKEQAAAAAAQEESSRPAGGAA